MNNTTSKPLCVDLDGTLIATDTLWESVLLLLRHNLLLIFFYLYGSYGVELI